MQNEQINLKLIIQGCKSGNRTSQKFLYKHFYAYSMSVCLRYSKNREEAEEILNDGFMKVFNKIDQFDLDHPFKNWLRRILINASIDFYRKHKRYALSLELDSIQEPGFESDIFSQLSYQDVIAEIQKLPPAYRMVFNLFAIEEFTHQEIADKLGISVGSSKSNLSRAKVKLQKQLVKRYPQYQNSKKYE